MEDHGIEAGRLAAQKGSGSSWMERQLGFSSLPTSPPSPQSARGHSASVAIMVDKPVVDDDRAGASDTVKNVESGYVSTKLESRLDQFEDPDQGLSAEERAKKVSDA